MNCNIMQKIKKHLGFSNQHQNQGYFVTATDTNIGKSHCCALLMQALNANYFKPIQAGDLETGGDTALVQQLSGMSEDYFFKPVYNLQYSLSPHEAAAKQGTDIQMDLINLPTDNHYNRPIIVEGAGGVMVPLNDNDFMIDLIAKFSLPAIVVVRSELGTLNHSLLTINALKACNIPIAAVIMNGKSMPNNMMSLKKLTHIDHIFANEW